jgi:hypothetical protein
MVETLVDRKLRRRLLPLSRMRKNGPHSVIRLP